MINIEALFKISYGLYVICSGKGRDGNGYISNTFFQVTAEPPRFATCCSKNNYTADIIREHGSFSVSVLHTETPTEIFSRFGYRSGKDSDKLEGMDLKIGESGVPILLNDSMAFMECKVDQVIDVGTHWLFIGDLIQSDIINSSLEPITYLYYRDNRKAFAPKNAPTYVDKSKLVQKAKVEKYEQYQCAACGYIYDEEEENVKFADLPDDWLCPVCGSEKEDFFKI